MDIKELAILVIDGRQSAVNQTQMVMDQLFKVREELAKLTKTVGEIKAITALSNGIPSA